MNLWSPAHRYQPPSRQGLIRDLTVASEIEHSITCQYLFAAFSLKTHPREGGVTWPQVEKLRHFKAEILSVAREEMAHHGLVSNLLILLGGAPHFHRPAFPHPSYHTPPYVTAELLPFSDQALERFARYEQLHTPGLGPPGNEGEPNTIGDLYQKIRDDMETVHKRAPRLFIGPVEHQITNRELRLRPGQFDIDLNQATDLRSAQTLLDQILEHDHYERMVALRQEFDELQREAPTLVPTRPVISNPSILRTDDQVTAIDHPATRAAAELFNDAYEVMVLLLDQLYGRGAPTGGETEGLIRTAFFPLMTSVIRPLGEILTQMPAGLEDPGPTAGAGFELPFGLPLAPFPRSAWHVAHERLEAMARRGRQLADELPRTDEPWTRLLQPRLEALAENLERISANFENYMGLRGNHLHTLLRNMR